MTIEQLITALLVLGMVPRRISHTVLDGERSQVRWKIYATFWRLTIRWSGRGRHTWQFTVPLIQRLTSAIWAALKGLVLR